MGNIARSNIDGYLVSIAGSNIRTDSLINLKVKKGLLNSGSPFYILLDAACNCFQSYLSSPCFQTRSVHSLIFRELFFQSCFRTKFVFVFVQYTFIVMPGLPRYPKLPCKPPGFRGKPGMTLQSTLYDIDKNKIQLSNFLEMLTKLGLCSLFLNKNNPRCKQTGYLLRASGGKL